MGRRLLLAVLGFALVLGRSSPARADGCNTCGLYLSDSLLVGLGAGVVAVGSNGYWTVRLIASPTTLPESSAKRALYWTAWQPVLLYPLSFMAGSRYEEAEILQAATSWPMAISGAGLALAYPDHPTARYSGLAMAGVADALLLAHDTVRLVEGERVGPTYAWFETVAGSLQLAYGLSASLSVSDARRPLALGLSGVPLVLTVHGVLSVVLPETRERRVQEASRPALWFASLPVPGGVLASANGRF